MVATPVADCSFSGLGFPDPDPYKNVTDPQHLFLEMSGFRLRKLLYIANNDGWDIFIEKYLIQYMIWQKIVTKGNKI